MGVIHELPRKAEFGEFMKLNRKAKRVEMKQAAKAASASKETVTAQAEAAPTPARPQKIRLLKKETKYRGARDAWFQRLVEFDGKTESEFIESTKAKPPALTKNGTAENPSGWVRYFVRTGVMSLQAQ